MKHVLKTFQPMGEISRNNKKQKEIKMKTNYPWTLNVNGTFFVPGPIQMTCVVGVSQPFLLPSAGNP